jgi:hypothetical protein
MSATWFDDDDRLAEELAAALREDSRPDPDRVAMVMAGYDIVMADTVEAELISDSAVDELAAVRSDQAGARMLTYAEPVEGDGDRDRPRVEIDLEIVDGRIVGHVDPPRGGVVRLEQPTLDEPGVVEVEPDELGSFEFELRSPATLRLRYVDADGRSVATGWLDGPHPTRP